MKTLWVDASNGAAGDMLLAALLDAGADLDAVRTGLRGIGVEPVGLTLNAVRRHGLRAAQVVVDARHVLGRGAALQDRHRRVAGQQLGEHERQQ